MKLKPIALIFLVITAFCLFSRKVIADDCAGAYGSSQTCPPSTQIEVKKQVLNPLNNVFYDNLSSTAYQFSPGQNIFFKITVTNLGSTISGPVTVTDNLPASLTPVTVTDSSNPTLLTFQFPAMGPTQSQNSTFTAQIAPTANFPQSMCDFNIVNASVLINNTPVALPAGQSQFCININKLTITPTQSLTPSLSPTPAFSPTPTSTPSGITYVKPPPNLPSTGPSDWPLYLGLNLIIAGAGFTGFYALTRPKSITYKIKRV